MKLAMLVRKTSKYLLLNRKKSTITEKGVKSRLQEG